MYASCLLPAILPLSHLRSLMSVLPGQPDPAVEEAWRQRPRHQGPVRPAGSSFSTQVCTCQCARDSCLCLSVKREREGKSRELWATCVWESLEQYSNVHVHMGEGGGGEKGSQFGSRDKTRLGHPVHAGLYGSPSLCFRYCLLGLPVLSCAHSHGQGLDCVARLPLVARSFSQHDTQKCSRTPSCGCHM